jgi:hypothetical protein
MPGTRLTADDWTRAALVDGFDGLEPALLAHADDPVVAPDVVPEVSNRGRKSTAALDHLLRQLVRRDDPPRH